MSEKLILVVTFSPGGGCSELADAATLILQNAGYRAECLDITSSENRDRACSLEIHVDMLLCIFPVYAHRLPQPVDQFFRCAQLSVEAASMILTYGSVGIGNAAGTARQLFRDINIPLCRIMSCPVEHSYAYTFTERQKLPDSLDKVGRFILSVAEDAKTEEYPLESGGFDPIGMLPRGLASRLFAEVPKTVESECAFCGNCAEVCPTDAITLDRFQIDSVRCIRCAACVKICPHEAKTIKLTPWTRAIIRRGFSNEADPRELTRAFDGE